MSNGQKSIRTAFREGGIARAFSSRNYKIFWAGHTSFILGVWINNIALGWLMWELTTSKTWLGLIAAASMMPMMFFGPIAGATADRYGHRLQVQISTVLGGVLTVVIATLTLMGQMSPGLLIGLAAIGGISRAFNVTARGAMLHGIVEPDTLSAAIAVNGASYHGGRFVGPALGGMIFTFAGVSAALFVYAFLAFAVAVTLQFLVIGDDGTVSRKRQSLARELAAGFGYTYAHTGIRNLMVMTAVIALLIWLLMSRTTNAAASQLEKV